MNKEEILTEWIGYDIGGTETHTNIIELTFYSSCYTDTMN